MLRRITDILGAALLLILLAPVLAVAALVVLLGSGRPLFFGHERIGRGGRRFLCWKLRTMHVDAEGHLERDTGLRSRWIANGYKLPNGNDPRVTRVGRWLRRTYIDEIPQLINVMGGSMSLVGPRPVVAVELEEFGERAPELLRAKPGLIGAWTSRGRQRPDYPERAAIELEYVQNRSASRDLGIFLRSIPVVLKGQDDG